jgi:hypothetical protein
MRELPTGIQVFETIRANDCLYVDKTAAIHSLVSRAKNQFFLSRPRRFGKTLLCSTLTALFEGRRDLFEGLFIAATDWKWEKHPVIRLDMSLGSYRGDMETARASVHKQLENAASRLGLGIRDGNETVAFGNLITDAVAQFGTKAVVIIDEYDSPLLSVIEDRATFEENRVFLREFYKTVKGYEEHVRFAFLTGITKFSQVSVFSALNNLTDLTLEPEFADLLGITQEELEHDFADRIDTYAGRYGGREAYLARLKDFYNGYRFSKKPLTVYNPFGTLKHFDGGDFAPYWFESGTPSYLINLVDNGHLDILALGDQSIRASDFRRFDSDNMEPNAVLYQSGYLTVTDYIAAIDVYKLGYPNTEVRSSFASELCVKVLRVTLSQKNAFVAKLPELLHFGELGDAMDRCLIPFLSAIPHTISIRHEFYFQTVFHLIFTMLGLNCRSEVAIATGRVDSIVETEGFVYCFEFKLDGTADEALKQIDDKGYLTPWTGSGKTLFKVGVSFDFEKRAVKEWKSARAG